MRRTSVRKRARRWIRFSRGTRGTVLLSTQPEQQRRERIAHARDADGGAISAASADETVDSARQTSNVTHGDPAAGWGTALFHLMRKYGWSSVQATKRLKSRWPCLGEWNESFTTFLKGW